MILDGVSSAGLLGVDAGVLRWPSLGGLEVDQVSAPGMRGRVIAGSAQNAVQFVVEVDVEGKDAAEIQERVRVFTAWVDPRRGPRRFSPMTDDSWVWLNAIVVGGFEWEDHASFWRAELTLECDPDPVPKVDEAWNRTGAGNVSVRRVKGHAPSYPTIEVKGTLGLADGHGHGRCVLMQSDWAAHRGANTAVELRRFRVCRVEWRDEGCFAGATHEQSRPTRVLAGHGVHGSGRDDGHRFVGIGEGEQPKRLGGSRVV